MTKPTDRATHIQEAKAAMSAVNRLLSDAIGHQTDLQNSLAAIARNSNSRRDPIGAAIAAYEYDISPEGIKENLEIYAKIGVGRHTAADLRFDAMETLRDALTVEMELLPADALHAAGAPARRARKQLNKAAGIR
jgi:hypothetical protein